MFKPETFHNLDVAFTSASFDAFVKAKETIMKNIPMRNCKLLDIGSADGKSFNEVVSKYLKEVNFSTVIGSDYDKEMIEFASKTYGNLSFKLLDIEKENFDKNSEWKNLKNSFDLLTSTYTFCLLKDVKMGFMNARELMKPKGIFWLSFPMYASFLEILMKCKVFEI